MIRYAITDGTCRREDARRWADAGIDYVQLRDRELSAGELVHRARMLVDVMGAAGRVLVNSRVDVALAAGAAGVHLTAHPDELTVAQVRQVFPGAVVSVSCHSVEAAVRVREAGADLILFAPVFEKRVAGELVVEGAGLATLRRVCEAASPVGVLALGGVTAVSAGSCVEGGAVGVAGIRMFG